MISFPRYLDEEGRMPCKLIIKITRRDQTNQLKKGYGSFSYSMYFSCTWLSSLQKQINLSSKHLSNHCSSAVEQPWKILATCIPFIIDRITWNIVLKTFHFTMTLNIYVFHWPKFWRDWACVLPHGRSTIYWHFYTLTFHLEHRIFFYVWSTKLHWLGLPLIITSFHQYFFNWESNLDKIEQQNVALIVYKSFDYISSQKFRSTNE